MSLHFDAATHTYTWNGERVPNVTAVTETLIDFGGVSPAVLAEARDRGQAVHLACQYHDEGGVDEDSLPDELRGYLSAYKLFQRESGFMSAMIEYRVYSPKMRYAGTLDRIGIMPVRRKPRYVLIDIKAVAKVQPATGPQTAAYVAAWDHSGGCRIDHRFALQLRPDGTYRLHEHTDLTDLSIFLAALSVYNWRHRHLTQRKETEYAA